MLRLGRSLSSKTNPPDGSASATLQYRLDQALAARNEAEEALALSRVEKKELQARVVELEGGPAARDLAATKRALESAKAQLPQLSDGGNATPSADSNRPVVTLLLPSAALQGVVEEKPKTQVDSNELMQVQCQVLNASRFTPAVPGA